MAAETLFTDAQIAGLSAAVVAAGAGFVAFLKWAVTFVVTARKEETGRWEAVLNQALQANMASVAAWSRVETLLAWTLRETSGVHDIPTAAATSAATPTRPITAPFGYPTPTGMSTWPGTSSPDPAKR